MKLLAAFAILIFAGSNVFAAEATSSVEAQLVADLVRELRPYVGLLDRDAKVYHWFVNTNKDQDLSLRDPYFSQHYERTRSSFYRDNVNGEYDVLGPGVYAAATPWFSKSYGNNMLEISIKKGVPVLQYPADSVFGLTKRLNQIFIMRLGAKPTQVGDAAFTESELRRYTARALDTLGVKAILYPWAPYTIDLMTQYCIVSPTIAALMLGKADGKNIKLRGFTGRPKTWDAEKLAAYTEIEAQFKLHGRSFIKPLASTRSERLKIYLINFNKWKNQTLDCSFFPHL
jgi:hypothetical protein